VAGCADPKPAQLIAHGAQLISGSAQFEDAHTVVVNGRRLVGEHLLIATGAHPPRPPIAGLEYMTTHVEALQWEQPPQRLAVVGGGIIGMEFAYLFARGGARVVVLELLDHVLDGVDAEIRAAVVQHAQQLGVTFLTGARVQAILPEGGQYRVQVEGTAAPLAEEVFAHVLLAAGQAPAVDGLGLERAGVSYTRAGVATDAALRTNVPHIWAAGDVRAGAPKLTQIASYEGKLAARNALSGQVLELNERIVPYLIGLSPPVAAVGLTEEAARDAGYQVGVHRQAYREVCPAGNVVGEPEGFLKVVFDATSGKLLGAHAFGSGSPELVQQIAFAMLGGLTLRQAGAALYTFPGLSEVVWYALRPHPGDPA
jgi:pyruvate/2-oxoglutarate dehydrogenase complex dihydrolipoamide dehydrogenase (E3) component